jgi:hypothetical protein
MKKKKTIKRKKLPKKKISKTEKKLRNQLRWNREVIRKKYNKLYELLKNNNFNTDKKIGKKTIGTKIVELQDEETERLDKIKLIEQKLEKRFKYKLRKPKEVEISKDSNEFKEELELGNAWDIKDIINQLLDYMQYKGVSINKVKDKVIKDAFKIISMMQSNDVFKILVNSFDNILNMYK